MVGAAAQRCRDPLAATAGGIDPATLPMCKTSSGACKPVYPHQFMRVNNVFEVAGTPAALLLLNWKQAAMHRQ